MDVGDRVIMINSDGFAKRGQTGVVLSTKQYGNSVLRVQWDVNGKIYLHRKACLALDTVMTDTNPNIMFKMRKRRD